MTKLLSTSIMFALGAVAVPACSNGVDGGQSAADVESNDHKVKPGKPGISFEVCTGLAHEALQFFQGQTTGSEREVFATELQSLIEGGQPLTIVDVRPAFDFSTAHIPKAVNIPLDLLFDQGLCSSGNGKQCSDDDDDDHDRDYEHQRTNRDHDDDKCKPLVLPTDGSPIVLVSANGHASALAVGVLGAMGYNVYSLRFGMVSWAKTSNVAIQRPDTTQKITGLGGALTL